MAETELKRLLIWGKTYPELSSRHAETVCTGAVDEQGRPVRLYPVPLRYLQGEQQYKLYDIVEVLASRNPRDPRPESYKIVPDSLRVLGHVPPDNHEWAGRQDWVFRDPTWHFDALEALEAARFRDNTSMGLVRPGRIERVYIKPKRPSARREFEAKWLSVTSQADLFLPEYRDLEFLANEIRIAWRCAGPCEACHHKPHDLLVLDWGLLELARRTGDWEQARQKLETIANLETHDFRLFVGNFFTHPHVWGVIGLWYPKRQAQQRLL